MGPLFVGEESLGRLVALWAHFFLGEESLGALVGLQASCFVFFSWSAACWSFGAFGLHALGRSLERRFFVGSCVWFFCAWGGVPGTETPQICGEAGRRAHAFNNKFALLTVWWQLLDFLAWSLWCAGVGFGVRFGCVCVWGEGAHLRGFAAPQGFTWGVE